MSPSPIPFNRPYMTGRELGYIADAHARGHLSGDGEFTRRCHAWLEETTGTEKALLTHSCTGALEMAALLLDLAPGDEVVLPSFTFVSTANAIALRGAVPVFVDVRAEDLEARLERLMPVVVQRVAALGGDIAVVDAVDAAFVTRMRPHPETYTYPCGFYTCTGTRVVPMPQEVATVRVRARALRSTKAGAQ